jgi:hypothetical protein
MYNALQNACNFCNFPKFVLSEMYPLLKNVFSYPKSDSFELSVIMVVGFTKSCVLQQHKSYKLEGKKGSVRATR